MLKASPQKYLSWSCLLGVLAVGLICLVNWAIDPLQFYRVASYPPNWVKERRFQYPGLARNYSYDAVVVGTSVSENFTSSLLEEKLGWKAVNLSLPGASAKEQSLMLEVALRTGKVKSVLWDLNAEYLGGGSEWVANFDGAFPAYLYDVNAWNEVPNYLLNVDTTKASVKVMLRRLGLPAYQTKDVKGLFTSLDAKCGGELVRAAWHRKSNARQKASFAERMEGLTKANIAHNFEVLYLAGIARNPQVRFYLYLPPMSPAFYRKVKDYSPQSYEAVLALREQALVASKKYSNLQVYDFQDIERFGIGIDHYRDLVHFDYSVNERIADSIKGGANRLEEACPAVLGRFVEAGYVEKWLGLTESIEAGHNP
jgi:hypothetical protein